MSRYREAVGQLHTLAEISSIMRSMKGLAFMETRKLSRFLLNQQRVVACIEAAAADYAMFYPLGAAEVDGMACVYLVIGSERGFCGDYNEALLRALEGHPRCATGKATLIIAVGRKLCLKLEEDPRAAALLDGPMAAEEVDNVLDRVVDTLSLLHSKHGPLALTVVHHDVEHGPVRFKDVLPPFQKLAREGAPFAHAPLLYLAPAQFVSQLIDHYLFALLHEVFFTALMAENSRRGQHLQGALDRLERKTAALVTQRNTLRQEEITEEIEVILLNAAALGMPSPWQRGTA